MVTRAVHRLVWRETINALDRKDPLFWKGTCHWFTISTLHLVAAYVVANSIPIFSQLNGLIGAVLSPFLSFVIPVALLFKSGLKPTKLDVVCSVVYVLAVGGYAFGAGTYASIVSRGVLHSTPSTRRRLDGVTGAPRRSPSTACLERWAAPSRAIAWRGSASSRRDSLILITPNVTTHPHHYSTTNVNLSIVVYDGWGQANQSSMIRTTG